MQSEGSDADQKLSHGLCTAKYDVHAVARYSSDHAVYANFVYVLFLSWIFG